MSPERWQRIEELYHAAQSTPPEERHAFLDRACVGDADLREELESLLRYAPVSEAYTRPVPNVHAGMLLGHYRVDERIGAGGMGEVFRGVDTRLDYPMFGHPPESRQHPADHRGLLACRRNPLVM